MYVCVCVCARLCVCVCATAALKQHQSERQWSAAEEEEGAAGVVAGANANGASASGAATAADPSMDVVRRHGLRGEVRDSCQNTRRHINSVTTTRLPARPSARLTDWLVVWLAGRLGARGTGGGDDPSWPRRVGLPGI